MGYNPWSRKESDMTERLTHTELMLMSALLEQYFLTGMV